MTFADRLDAAVGEVRNPALLGIDPHLDLLPEEFSVARDASAPRAERVLALERFCKELVELAAGRVAAVKPQSAFFELFGSAGVGAWENVVEHAHRHDLLVIGDVKRGDIASTAAAYARAFLEGVGDETRSLCDAITVNPFLGADTLAPFLDACRRTGGGLFVLVRTSNPESGLFQLHGSPPLCDQVADRVRTDGEALLGECGMSSLGAVVSATHPDELRRLRGLMPKTPLLLPGYGAQGASADDVAAAFPDREHPWRGGLVNSSRGVAFAWRTAPTRPWKDAASEALDRMISELRAALDIRST